MASTMVITSDLSGEPEASPVTFALFGTAYEIDLTAAEQKDLERQMKVYISKARHIGAKTATAGKRSALPADPKAIRAWANAHGIECPKSGRIPQRVVDAYNEAR